MMMKRRIKAPLFVLFLLAFSFSCSRYPSIPEVEKLNKEAREVKKEEKKPETKGKAIEIPDIPKPESIGEVFEKKASKYISVEEDSIDKDYIIGPEDVLKIQVWDNEDLNRVVYISREGGFSYPLIGKVKAEGLTIAQLEKEIGKRLTAGYLLDPQVNITMEEYKSKRVYVMGEVGGSKGLGKGPGTYPLTGQTITLIEILAKTGGPTREAGEEVLVIRPLNERKKAGPILLEEAREDELIRVKLRQLLEGDTTQNIILKHGDTILVPEVKYFYVFGEVNNPGRYNLEKATTVLKAITIAGGVTKFAATNKTVIVREKEGERVKFLAKMGDVVQPEDIIMVPESPL